MAKIIYTHTDEAPLLATYSFLPIIAAYAKTAGVDVETRDISLAGRVIAQFPDRLTEEQCVDDALAELGELATRPEANIIQRPTIAASIPLGRIASARDVAAPIVFLCSDLARHITGEIVNVNGGSVLCG